MTLAWTSDAATVVVEVELGGSATGSPPELQAAASSAASTSMISWRPASTALPRTNAPYSDEPHQALTATGRRVRLRRTV